MKRGRGPLAFLILPEERTRSRLPYSDFCGPSWRSSANSTGSSCSSACLSWAEAPCARSANYMAAKKGEEESLFVYKKFKEAAREYKEDSSGK